MKAIKLILTVFDNEDLIAVGLNKALSEPFIDALSKHYDVTINTKIEHEDVLYIDASNRDHRELTLLRYFVKASGWLFGNLSKQSNEITGYVNLFDNRCFVPHQAEPHADFTKHKDLVYVDPDNLNYDLKKGELTLVMPGIKYEVDLNLIIETLGEINEGYNKR